MAMVLEYKGQRPTIGNNVFIAPTATLIGAVEIKDGASIWYGAVLRGDMAPIIVGENSNIQDNCTVHTDFEKPTTIGDHVTVGHNAVLHACTVEANCLIGIHAVILTDAWIKTGSMVAAGAVVTRGQIVGPCHLVTGVPAVLKKVLPPASIAQRQKTAQNYLQLAAAHRELTPALRK